MFVLVGAGPAGNMVPALSLVEFQRLCATICARLSRFLLINRTGIISGIQR